jgi:K+-transporting ATPase ATPase C chain
MKSLRAFIVFTLLVGVAYPLAITGIAQLLFHEKANGSLVVRDGNIVGSALLAQKNEDARLFWPRPSAADYATVPSGASNFGPTSAALKKQIAERAAKLGTNAPADLLFASGSGLDPHISPEAARFQVGRVAAARSLPAERVRQLVEKFTEPATLGFMGQARVNVLLLNLALDEYK